MRPELLALGSCHVDLMLQSMEVRHPVTQIYVGTHTYNTIEVIQFLKFCSGETELPDELLPFIYRRSDLAVFQFANELSLAKALFLEICNATVIKYGEHCLHRNLVAQKILHPLQELGSEIAPLANEWFFRGIEHNDQEVRRRAVTKLMPLLPRSEEWKLRLKILNEAEGLNQDSSGIKSDIMQIADMIGCKIIMLGHVLRYMPDGRPLYWPSTFMVQLQNICTELNLPIVDPARLVQEVGSKFALKTDGRHYTQSFIDLIADRLFSLWQENSVEGFVVPRSLIE
jgi:hypothetical protein